MDEVYGVSPLRLTAGLRRTFLSREEYTALGDETTRRELAKLKATREFASRAVEMQRREEQLRHNARQSELWKQICCATQAALVVALLFPCMATFVVLFANVFPASMGLTAPTMRSVESASYHAAPKSVVDPPGDGHILSDVHDKEVRSLQLQDDLQMSSLIVPFHVDLKSTCFNQFVHLWKSNAAVELHIRTSSKGRGPEQSTSVTQQPPREGHITSTVFLERGAAAMLWWDPTSCPRYGPQLADAPTPALHDLTAPSILPGGHIEDEADAVSIVNEREDVSSHYSFVPALPLPQTWYAVSVLPAVQLSTPAPTSEDTVKLSPHLSLSEADSEISELPPWHAVSPASVPEIAFGTEACPNRFYSVSRLVPSQHPVSLALNNAATATAELHTEPVSEVEPVIVNPSPPGLQDSNQVTREGSLFSQESMVILRGALQGPVCLESEYDAVLEKRLMGVKSIAMPPLPVLRALVSACGAVLSFHMTMAVHIGSSAATHLSSALQQEPVAYAAAWLMLLSAMIAAAYVLLSTEGVSAAEAARNAGGVAAPVSLDLHFRSEALQGEEGSPAYHPGQLFPSKADERESSGSPIAASVVRHNKEKRITPEPIATAVASAPCCSSSAACAGSPSSSLTGSIAEVGPIATSVLDSDVPIASQSMDTTEARAADEVNAMTEMANRIDALEQQLQEEVQRTSGKDARIKELLEQTHAAMSKMLDLEAGMATAREQSQVQAKRADELEAQLAAEAARANNAEAAAANFEASAEVVRAACDAAVAEVASDQQHQEAASASPAAMGNTSDQVLECLAEVAKECDELEAAQQELAAACAHHGAQGSSLQELMKQAQATLILVQQQQEQGGGHVHSDEREQRLDLAQGDLKKSVENMLYQIQLLVEPTKYLAKRVYGQSLPEPQLFGENWSYEVCNVMKQAAVQLDAAEVAEHTAMAVVHALLQGGDVSAVLIDDAELGEGMAKQLQRLKGFAMEAWASRHAVMHAASGLANAVDAPAISVESSGWEWSSEIKSVLDKAVTEVNKLQAAEEGVVNALEVMLVSDDLQLENSSVSSAAAEGLSRVHFQLQQAGGRETDLAKQVNDLLRRQMDLESHICALEAADQGNLSGIGPMGTASHARGGPSPEIPSGSLFDKQSTWLQRYDRLMEAPDPLTGVKVKLHVLPGGHVVPIMEATSIIQAGLESVHERAPSMLEDNVGPSSHSKASLGLGAPEADADCMPLHSLNRQASFSHEADIDTHGCFQTHTEVSAQGSPGGSHAVKDGAVELQRVLDNVAIHAGSCEMPQVVFDSTAVASQVEARYASLEAEYGGTHLTAGEGRELHTYLSETLQHAVSSLPTPSASEASYSGNTENEDCLYGATGDSEQESDCGQPWMGKFGEQQMYIDVVSQNLNGLVDQQARFLHLLAELVTCQEQQETARQAHEALHQRITQWREALLDGSVTAGPPSGDLRQLSASREALFAKITGFQPQEDQSRDLDNVMKEFHEVEEKLALHGSAVERPEDLQQLQRDLRELEDLQSMMQDSGAQLQEDMAQARSGICSTVEVIHENTMSLLHFFSEGGMEIPQKMSALAAKMAAQVAEADGGGYGPPLAARGLAAVLSGASTPMSASIAKVQDWQTNPSLLDSLSPVLHFGSACNNSAPPEAEASAGGILLNSSHSSALAQPSPMWAGIADFPAPSPASPDDPPLSPPTDHLAPAHPSPPQPLQLAPLVFTTSAPEMLMPTPTFGPTPFQTAPRAPPTQAEPRSVAPTPGTVLRPFHTPCCTEPSSIAQDSASGTALNPSPLTGADSAAEAEDFLARRPPAQDADPGADESEDGRVTPRIAGVSSDIPRPTASAPSSRPASNAGAAPESADAAADAPADAHSVPSSLKPDGGSQVGGPGRPTGIRRAVAAGPRRSLQPEQVVHSRLPRAPQRLSAPAFAAEPSPSLMEITQHEPTPGAPLMVNSPLPTSISHPRPGSQGLPQDPSGTTVASSAGPSIPSAPTSQVTQREPEPSMAQLPQQPMPCVPPLMPSASPLVLRGRPSLPAVASSDSDQSAPSQLQQQDVRRGVAVSPHTWQRALHEAHPPPPVDDAPLSPRNCMASLAGQPAAVSLLDVDLLPTPGLEASIGAIGEMSPITDDWRRSPMVSPSKGAAEDVRLTLNALFDAPTPRSDPLVDESSGDRPGHASKGSAAWNGRMPSDENSCENLPMFRRQ